MLVALALSVALADTASDTTYTSDALRQLVADAAMQNQRVPASLQSYRARVESELSLLIRRTDGSDVAVQIEQVESTVRWQGTGALTQHVVGYRARLAGPNLSALGIIHQAWIVPVLYGNRLELFAGRDTTRRARRRARHDTLIVVLHPLADDRESVYRFSGGDTVVTIRAAGRAIPVAIVHVVARPGLRRPTAVFQGDLYVDAVRKHIVRMRGRFDIIGSRRTLGDRIRSAVIQAVAFVDLTNSEVAGAYWLPATQRIEGQFGSPLSGDARSAFRVVSHFDDYEMNDTTPVLAADSMRLLPHRLTFAPSDSLSGFHEWNTPLGSATESVRTDDFQDLLPDRWRDTGPPRLDFRTEHFADALHFDRVEGLYTGFGANLKFRDAAPGLVARANAGYAWTEQTLRGGAELSWIRGPWTLGARAARTLDNTNDFATAFTPGPGLEALIVQDDYDYVDRRRATVSLLRAWGPRSSLTPLLTRWEFGVGRDDGERTRLTRGIFAPSVFLSDSLLRPNRGVAAGDYVRGAFTVAYNPGVDAGYVRAGLGARLRYEGGGGQLAWQRLEGRLAGNEIYGPFLLGARLDGGIVAGTRIPPQQIFEIGYREGLLAYNYKQFGGDRAAVLQEEALYALPLWRRPLRIGALILPSPSPAVALGAQHGWADASTRAGRLALIGLGPRVDPATNLPIRDPATGLPLPASRPTDGVRTSIDLTLRFFGNSVAFGVAQALDAGAKPGFVFRLGSTL
jgi:hypothetical protein